MSATNKILQDEVLKDLRTAVFTALGAASVCWESMEGTGVFQSDRAKQIGDELVEYIEANYSLSAYSPPSYASND